MDFTALLASLTSQSGPLLVAVAAIAAVMILPGVARWGYDYVIYWFHLTDGDGGDGDDDDELADSFIDETNVLEYYPNWVDCPEHLQPIWDKANREDLESAYNSAEDEDEDGSYGRGMHGDYQ